MSAALIVGSRGIAEAETEEAQAEAVEAPLNRLIPPRSSTAISLRLRCFCGYVAFTAAAMMMMMIIIIIKGKKDKKKE